MFYNNQKEADKTKYKRFLNAAAVIGSLQSPKSKTPQINYRLSEEIFCASFNAENLNRLDLSIDAFKPYDGIGIKTFQGSRLQKIAEFNNEEKFPKPREQLELAKAVSSYRNMRLENDIKNFSVQNMIYHFTYRKRNGEINIFEEQMHKVNIEKILLSKSNKATIVKFSDGGNEYSFNKTKSTLYKTFSLKNPLDTFIYNYNKADLDYLLENLIAKPEDKIVRSSVILGLFKKAKPRVAEKSGLNQWNAEGRPRHPDEVYIPVPRKIHKDNPNFFPPRDKTFLLETNDGEKFLAKICQSANKALMTNPNKDLGKWLLRKILHAEPKQLITFDYLKKIKIDSVIIQKFDDNNFKIIPHRVLT